MSQFSNNHDRQQELLEMINEFITSSSGLKGTMFEESITVHQTVDDREIVISKNLLEDVFHRVDSEGKSFIQVNCSNSVKLLITEKLIGFKPFALPGLDMNRLPKVVTTPDLTSVLSAIEDTLSGDVSSAEVDLLRKVYSSILQGGESVGFNLDSEKDWVLRTLTPNYKLVA